MSNFGKNLKSLRKKIGYSQRKLAEVFNVSNGTIALWETNKRQPDYDTALKIAKFFEITLDVLLGNDTAQNQLILPFEEFNKELAARGITEKDFNNMPAEDKELLYTLAEKLVKQRNK